MADFRKIAIGIKTFLRDSHMYAAVQSILVNMPCAQILIADDGRIDSYKFSFYENLKKAGHQVIVLPFDSGFGKKSNILTTLNIRPYLLIGSDDFDFTREAAQGVLKLQEILDYCPEVHIASGRVRNRPYEFYLEEKDGVVTEIPVTPSPGSTVPWYYDVDLTVNYCLIRQEVFKKVRWDDDAKIGQGEHAAWFLDVRHAGFKVAYVPGVSINEQNLKSSQEYRSFRARANSSERSCFKKRNIKKYILGNGNLDFQE